ncbi:MAG: molybdate ABC transporter substrate-binding protein, partial [Anaerolineae bacterium]
MSKTGGWLFLCLVGLLAACAGNSTAVSPANDPLLVAAASNLQFAFTEMGQQFEAQTGTAVTFTFSSSGNLAAQIENGAPYDLFAAADETFIDRLAAQDLIFPESRQVYAQGQLVLAVNCASGVTAMTLDDLLADNIRQIAIANPEHAPYGRAAQQALQSANLWDALQPKIVYAENVRQALQFVQTGDVPAGLVALAIADVPEVTMTAVPATAHQPLNQTLAIP